MPASTLQLGDSSPPSDEIGLQIRLLGPMEVLVDGRPLPRLRSRKGLWLLALLALRAGRSVERDWLAGTLWPECDESHARRSLRQSLHDLRLALGSEASRLSTGDPCTLRLDTCGASLDLLAFDAAVERGDPGSLEQAIKLYRGPLLEGCTEEWVLEERRRREEAYLQARGALAAWCCAQGEHAAEASYLRLAVAADPYREELQRGLMQSLASAGDTVGALLVYRQLRTLLAREMAAEPAQETTELFRRLRDGARKEPDARAPTTSRGASTVPKPSAIPVLRPGRTPQPLMELFGREEAVREITSLLSLSRLVTLTGTGGIGKTRLAIQVAQELREDFAEGAVFVNLASLSSPQSVPEAVRDALGVPERDVRRQTVETIKQYLSERRLLLMLDNCEHLLAACAELANALLGYCPELRILATSRQPLGMSGEAVWRVPSLALPPAARSGAAGRAVRSTSYAAVRLFVDRATSAESSFRVTPQNEQAIVRVCRQLDGIPLAIELAAARVRSLSVEEIGRRLSRGLRVLARGGPALQPRHQTLEAAFEWSWDLLEPAERTLLQRLSVFAGGWTLEAAEAVCADEDSRHSALVDRPDSISHLSPLTSHLSTDDVLDVLTSLVDKSLVVYQPGAGDNDPGLAMEDSRYHLLEPIRQFAANRLAESGEVEAVRCRHRDFFLQWAEETKPKQWGAEQAIWFNRLEREHDNLRVALAWCRSQEAVEQELRLTVALARFWDTYGYLREGLKHLEAAIDHIYPDAPFELQTNVLLCAGWSAGVQGDSITARCHLTRALSIARQHGPDRMLAQVLTALASMVAGEGDISAARALMEEALDLSRCLVPPLNHGAILNNLGMLELHQRNYAMARAHLLESIARCASVEHNPQMHGTALGNLSMLDVREGRVEDAEAHCAESLRVLQRSGSLVNVHEGLECMAFVAQARGEWERAARLQGAAYGLREAMGLPFDYVPMREETAAAARSEIGPETFATAYAEGQEMELGQAIAYALQTAPPERLEA